MKLRNRVLVFMALLILACLPAAALALTSAGATSTYSTYAGSSARGYALSFGVEHHLSGTRDLWTVYSAPALNAVRGANGKATVSTADTVYSAGWYGAWLMVRYQKSNGGYRVGWVPKSEINLNTIQTTRNIDMAYWNVKLKQACILTDDPLLESEILAYASAGEELTYLAYYCYNGGREYAYVQGELNGRPVCGFIPFDAIDW